MRILEISSKARRVKVLVESEEDLWTLKMLLKPGDLVEGQTTRDVAGRFGGVKERKPIIVKLRVEKLEFQPFSGRLRVFGVIVEGPEEYGVKGRHHSLYIEPGYIIILEREKGWGEKAIRRMENSGPRGRALIVAVDYDEYAFGILAGHGFKIVAEGSSTIPGKDDPSREEALERYVNMVSRTAVEVSKGGVNIVIIVGPGHVKHMVAHEIKLLAPTLRVYVDDTSMGGVAGLREALRRPSIIDYLREFSVIEAEAVIEEFMSLVLREPAMVAYGIEDVKITAMMGALKHVLVLDSLISSMDESIREDIESILLKAEDSKAKIIIVPEGSPPGERIEKLGGIIAILRYPVSLDARRLLT